MASSLKNRIVGDGYRKKEPDKFASRADRTVLFIPLSCIISHYKILRKTNNKKEQTMKKILVMIFVAVSAISLQGCISFNSLADAKNSQGDGEMRSYSADRGEVWRKTITIINQSKLDLISQDSDRGVILAQQPISPLSMTAGQNVAVFITERNGKTRVEVVGKKAMGSVEFVSRNWEKHLLKELDKSLSVARR